MILTLKNIYKTLQRINKMMLNEIKVGSPQKCLGGIELSFVANLKASLPGYKSGSKYSFQAIDYIYICPVLFYDKKKHERAQ